MKEKGQILICTAIMLNDHSNPYIESTTVLSDTCAIYHRINNNIMRKTHCTVGITGYEYTCIIITTVSLASD